MSYEPPPTQRPSPGSGNYGPPGNYPPPGYGPPGKPKRPWWQQWWAIVIAAFIVLFVGVGIGGASNTKTTSSKPGPTVTATATSIRTAPGVTVTAHPVITKVVRTKTRTETTTFTPAPKPAVGDGTYKVGRDIKSGEWSTDNTDGDSCYYEIDSTLDGGIESIVANENFDGSSLAQLDSGEYFKINGGCQWRHH